MRAVGSSRSTMIQLDEKKDYSSEVAERVGAAQGLAEGGQLREAVESLMGLEKACRLGNDQPSLKKVVLAMVRMCKDSGDFDYMNQTLLMISKRRAQSKGAVIAIVEEAMSYLDSGVLPDDAAKEKALVALRDVTEGRIYCEGERAKLSKTLSEMKEAQGDIASASAILQELHVETYGALTKREKALFILDQIRLSLALGDFVRALINSRKVNRKVLDDEGMDDVKIRFYTLMIEYHRREEDSWELAQCYFQIFKTPTTLADEAKWQLALSGAVLFHALSRHTNETNDFIHRLIKDHADRLDALPAFSALARALTTHEIVGYPMAHQGAYEGHPCLSGPGGKEGAAAAWAQVLHTRVTQHNIRTVAKYYRRVRMPRLAQLLGLEPLVAERRLAELVEDGDLWARIDRPKGIVRFNKAVAPEQLLSDWNSDISTLLGLVQQTTHLIQKENMLNDVRAT